MNRSPNYRQLETAREVVEALGGQAKAARLLEEKSSAVGNWIMRERIPAQQFLVITSYLEPLGFVVNPDVFAMKRVAA